MTVTLTAETIISAAALVAAIIALVTYFAKMVRWADKQRTQEEEIKAIKEEQTVLTYGVLACLKGLAEQGCDGPVHDAIDKLEKHLNVTAHK